QRRPANCVRSESSNARKTRHPTYSSDIRDENHGLEECGASCGTLVGAFLLGAAVAAAASLPPLALAEQANRTDTRVTIDNLASAPPRLWVKSGTTQSHRRQEFPARRSGRQKAKQRHRIRLAPPAGCYSLPPLWSWALWMSG